MKSAESGTCGETSVTSGGRDVQRPRGWQGFKESVRRRDTWYFDLIYRAGKGISRQSLPTVPGIHAMLRLERELRHSGWEWLRGAVYDVPIFRACCVSCGGGLKLFGGIPQVQGALRIELGEDVALHGKSTLSGGKLPSGTSLLRVGDGSFLGYDLDISVGERVIIGKRVLVATGVSIIGYDGHPYDAAARARNQPPGPEGYADIVIEDDVWIATGAIILKGVHIGQGAIVAAGAVVTRDVAPHHVVAGNPARTVRRLERAGAGDV